MLFDHHTTTVRQRHMLLLCICLRCLCAHTNVSTTNCVCVEIMWLPVCFVHNRTFCLYSHTQYTYDGVTNIYSPIISVPWNASPEAQSAYIRQTRMYTHIASRAEENDVYVVFSRQILGQTNPSYGFLLCMLILKFVKTSSRNDTHFPLVGDLSVRPIAKNVRVLPQISSTSSLYPYVLHRRTNTKPFCSKVHDGPKTHRFLDSF